MELQEGDGLMAGSRRRENLQRRTFCGTCGKCANPDEFARASRQILAEEAVSNRPTANKTSR